MKYRISLLIDEVVLGAVVSALAGYEFSLTSEPTATEAIFKRSAAINAVVTANRVMQRENKTPDDPITLGATEGASAAVLQSLVSGGAQHRRRIAGTLAHLQMSTNGIGPTLSKLKKRGYVRQVADQPGVWEATPQGIAYRQALTTKGDNI